MQKISKLVNKIGLYHQKYSFNPCFSAKKQCQYSKFSKNEEIKQETQIYKRSRNSIITQVQQKKIPLNFLSSPGFSSTKTNLQKNQQNVIPAPNKALQFNAYPKITSINAQGYINLLKQQGLTSQDILWIAAQKIHGSNFSIYFNGDTVKYGKRNSFLTNNIPIPCNNPQQYFNMSFFGAGNLMSIYHSRLHQVFKNLKEYDPKAEKFAIYGEYFGGCWPEKHPLHQSKNNYAPVQRQVYYTPKHQFIAFDIHVTTQSSSYWVDILDFQKILKNIIPYLPILKKGTFDEVYQTDIRIDSTIPQLLGLQKLQNNLIQGVVIRPNKSLYLKSGDRVVFKNKNRQFIQKCHSSQKAKFYIPQNIPSKPKINEYVIQLSKYINKNRINSVRSKYPDETNRKILKKLISDDILQQAKLQKVKLPEDQLEASEVKRSLDMIIFQELKKYFETK